MEKLVDSPVDLYLWENSSNVEAGAAWKWSWDTWNPIIERLFSEREAVKQVPCPVCGGRKLYAIYLAIRPKKSTRDAVSFTADRFYGCFSCQIQKRDVGETPAWLDEKEIYWASVLRKEEAEEELGNKLSGPIIRSNRD